MESSASHLIEPGVKYFLHQSLKSCQVMKQKYYTFYVNVALFIGLVGIFGIILYYMHKGKLTPQEKEAKKQEQYQVILSKINSFKDLKKKDETLLTDLPAWTQDSL